MGIGRAKKSKTVGNCELFLNRDLDSIQPASLIDNALVYCHRRPAKPTANEDCAGIVKIDDMVFLMVADGLGGLPQGAAASNQLIQYLSDQLTLETPDNCEKTNVAVRTAIMSANELILAHDDGRATTLSMVAISAGVLYPFHVGDSFSLVCDQQGKTKLLTVPHSPVGEDQANGLLSETEAMLHPERHLVSNVIGSRSMHLGVGDKLELGHLDTILVSSDGLFDNLYIAEIVAIIRAGPLPEAAAALLNKTTERMEKWGYGTEDTPSHPDDMAFILYRYSLPTKSHPPSY